MDDVIELLRSEPALWIGIAVLFGLSIGSFLNVVVYRLPKMMEREWAAQCAELSGQAPEEQPTFNLAKPRSRCPSCSVPIGALQNLPLVSWIALRGRCAACGVAIPKRYPLVELATGAIAGFLAWHYGFGPAAVLAFVFCATLLALALIDFDTQLLPDGLTLPLIWAGLLVNIWGVFAPLQEAVVGAVAGYLSLWTVYWAFKLVTGKEGMGYGDFKLLAAIGAWLGWQALPLVILLSSLAGAVIGIGLIAAARLGRSVPMPFGPYLVIAGAVALVWGDAIVAGYLKLLG
ncbi:MAG: A24 family peptidase [Betaproteobacteria bacterium]|jgi:leader peptidase (prepilin peptidase)/N-methyltransferase|nr:A24 family peptidase [Betaproteobacteria bacterium]